MAIGETFTANGVTLTIARQIKPGLLLTYDHTGEPRLHTGAPDGGFRGYLGGYLSRPEKQQRWRVTAWAGEGDKRRQIVRGGYRTKTGAVRALIRIGTALHT